MHRQGLLVERVDRQKKIDFYGATAKVYAEELSDDPALRRSAGGFLSKPFDPAQLAEAVRRLVAEWPGGAEAS